MGRLQNGCNHNRMRNLEDVGKDLERSLWSVFALGYIENNIHLSREKVYFQLRNAISLKFRQLKI